MEVWNMVHEFSMDTKTIVIVLTGLTVVGLLIFIAGLLMGISLRLPVSANQEAKSDYQEASDVEKPGDIPAETNNTSDQPASHSEDEASSSEQGEAESDEDIESTESPPAEKMSFSVQVGAFLDEKRAEELLNNLKMKGYEPYIFEARDLEGLSWYNVRIGNYADWEEADQAAIEFLEKEKMETYVRPVDEL
jgi:cell division protein FtsN